MESIETLLEEGFEPERDVYLCFGHDEEIMLSDDSGALNMARLFKERGIELESVIDEGGAIIPAKIKGLLDINIAGVGIAEKGYADFEIAVTAKGGHPRSRRIIQPSAKWPLLSRLLKITSLRRSSLPI